MPRSSALLVALALATSLPAQTAPDLALVPADAVGFIHLRLGDVLRGDQMKELRAVVAKAGPDALDAFAKRFVPDPTTIDRVTAYALPPRAEGLPGLPPQGYGPPSFAIVVRTTKPFAADALARSVAPKGRPVVAGGARFVADETTDVAVRVVDDQTFQVCPASQIDRVAQARPRPGGPLAPALALAETKAFTLAATTAAVPPELMAQLPLGPFGRLKLATFAVEFAAGGMAKSDFRLRFADADAAEDAEQVVHGFVEMVRGAMAYGRAELEKKVVGDGSPLPLSQLGETTSALMVIGSVRMYEAALKAMPLKRDGVELSMAGEAAAGPQATVVAGAAVAAGLTLPAVAKVREAAARSTSSNNLKQIVLAFHNYAGANADNMPAHAIYSKDRLQPLLSWRVALLPYLEQDDLFRQFKLDEPWDSDHNKTLIPRMPKVYLTPSAPPTAEPGRTYYQVFVGPDTPFRKGPNNAGLPRTFQDGTSNTILVAEAGESVVWTKPDDLAFDLKGPLPALGNAWRANGFLVALADGSVRTINPKISEKTLKAAVTPAGNEVLGPDW